MLILSKISEMNYHLLYIDVLEIVFSFWLLLFSRNILNFVTMLTIKMSSLSISEYRINFVLYFDISLLAVQ